MLLQINITGEIYFRVQTQEGDYLYTRGRQFHTDDAGVIVTERDYVLINATTIPQPYVEALNINEHGEVWVINDGAWAKIGDIIAIGFEHPELLEDMGDGYYKATEGSGSPVTGTAGYPPFEDAAIHYFPETGRKLRLLAVMDVKKYGRINDFIAKTKGISANMALHPELYSHPQPPLTVFNSSIEALEEAEALTKTRITGSVAARNKAFNHVVNLLHHLINYIQNLADNAANNTDAANYIINAGLNIKRRGEHTATDFKAENTKISGSVKLTAKSAGHRAAYEWQMKHDAQQWTYLPSTLKAKTIIKNLNPGTLVHFRHRVVTTTGTGSWSNEIAITVR